jgi:hypothetical protein
MIQTLINFVESKHFKIAIGIAGVVFLGIGIYDRYLNIQRNKLELEKYKQV